MHYLAREQWKNQKPQATAAETELQGDPVADQLNNYEFKIVINLL